MAASGAIMVVCDSCNSPLTVAGVANVAGVAGVAGVASVASVAVAGGAEGLSSHSDVSEGYSNVRVSESSNWSFSWKQRGQALALC